MEEEELTEKWNQRARALIMGFLRRLFRRRRDKTARDIPVPTKQTLIPYAVSHMDVGLYRGGTLERVKVVAAYQFQNTDMIYGIVKWDDSLYAAIILNFPLGTIKKRLLGKSTKVPAQLPYIVEIGPDVNVKYKEIGAFSPWPKLSARKLKETKK